MEKILNSEIRFAMSVVVFEMNVEGVGIFTETEYFLGNMYVDD